MKRRVMSYIEEDLYDKIKEEVRDNDRWRSISDFLRFLLLDYFEKEEKRNEMRDAIQGVKRDVNDIKRKVDILEEQYKN